MATERDERPEESTKPITTDDVDVTPPDHVYPDPDEVIHTGNTEPVPEDEWGSQAPDEVAPQKATRETRKK